MLPESNWINALKLPTQVMIGLFIASVALLGLDKASVIQLADFGALAKSVVIILIVISGSLSITGIGAFIKDQVVNRKKRSLFAMRQELRAQEKQNQKAEAQATALERVDHLSPKR